MNLHPIANVSSADKKCVDQLKQLVKNDAEVSRFSKLFTDTFLLNFIRGRKNRIDESFETLQNYIAARKEYSETFKSITAERLNEVVAVLDTGVVKFLKNPGPKGEIIFVVFVQKWDPSKNPVQDVLLFLTVLADTILASEQEMVSNGLIQISDLSGIGFKHSSIASPSAVKMFSRVFFRSYPLRLKGYHTINEPNFIKIAINFAKRFVPSKIQRRCHFHSYHVAGLHKHMDPSILPESLGGILKDEDAFMDFEALKKSVLEKSKFYEEFAEMI